MSLWLVGRAAACCELMGYRHSLLLVIEALGLLVVSVVAATSVVSWHG